MSQQTSFFLLSVVLGAAMGVVYDLFRVFRIIFPPAAKTAAAAVQDVIFWLIYGFALFCYSSAVCGGELRFFMLFGSLIGFTLYIVTLGNLITGILRRIASAVGKALHKVYSALFEPLVNILKDLCQKVRTVFVRNHKNNTKKVSGDKKPLKNVRGLVYNNVKSGLSVFKKGKDRRRLP